MTEASGSASPAVPPRRAFTRGVALLLVLYVAFAAANILRLPPLRGPDEVDHLAYVQVLRAQHALPVLPRYAAPGDPRAAEQAQHPPLYYAILAAASTVMPDLATPTGQRTLKLMSVLMGLTGLLAFAACARRVWPEDDATALLAVGFVALMPNMWVLTSHLNNTAGSLAASGVTLLLLQRALAAERTRPGPWLAVGLAAALGMLAKITAAWLVPVIAVALWAQARRRGGREAILSAVLALAPIVLLVGAWLLRNWLNFGEIMPQRVLDREYLKGGFMTLFFLPFAMALLALVAFVKVPLTALMPFWLLADATNMVTCAVVEWVALAVGLGPAAVGACRRWSQMTRQPTARQGLLLAAAVGLPAAWLIALEAVLNDWNTGLYAGRYAVDALPALALVFAAGMRVLLPAGRARAVGAAIWLVGLVVLSLGMHGYMVTFFTYR